MTPITLFVVLVAFAGGFFIGKAGKKRNQQDTPRFVDSEVAKEAGEKGRATIEARIKKRKSRIMERAQKEGRITNDDVEDLFCISDSTARNYLDELEKSGELTQRGEVGRGVFYTPTNQ